MNTFRKILAILLAAALLAGMALAEEAAPVEPKVAEELGEMDLPVEVAAPETPSETPAEAPVEAPAPPAEEEAPAAEAPAAEEAAPAAEEAAPATEEAPATVEAAPATVEAPAEESALEGEQAVAAPVAFPGAITLGVKEQFALNGAEAFGGPVTYVSSKPKLVSVDANGLVLARKKGAAVVTVYQGEAAVATCAVTVLKAPKKLTFPEKSVVLSAGQTRAFPAVLPKGSAGAVSYASDNPAVLAVDAAGNITGVSGGSATLYARAYNGKSASCPVRVLGGPAPTWVSVAPESLQLPVKATAQLATTFDPGCDAILTYATSNKKIVTVDANGLVTAKKAGQAVITVTTHNGLTASCPVLVFTAPKKVTLNVKKLSMYLNEGYQLAATITKNSVTEFTWASSNPSVASVDGNGLVSALNVGTANITVTTTNGKKATCKVTVKDPSGAGQGNVLFHEETDTLKITIVNDNGVVLSYIWAADPGRQLFKYYGNAKPIDILNAAVAANGLQDKIVLGFNASPPVSPKYLPAWSKDPNYSYREPSPLMIANGQVLVNDPYKDNKDKYLYWLDGNNTLCFSDRTLDQYTPEERAALYRRIIESGARNTVIWRPVLIANHQAVPLSKAFLTKTAGKKRKQALCQIDAHNFLLVTGSSKGMMDYPHFQSYLIGLGVVTAVEFDAGASSTTMIKSKYSTAFKKLVGGGRTLSMMMYFTE